MSKVCRGRRVASFPCRLIFTSRVTFWHCSKWRKFRELCIRRDASSTHLTPLSLTPPTLSVLMGYLFYLYVPIIRQDTVNTAYEYTPFACVPSWDICILLPETAPSHCCILRGPGGELIVVVLLGGTDLELQLTHWGRAHLNCFKRPFPGFLTIWTL